MIAVKPSFAYDSPRFHTLSTEPQVVSTSTQPSARSRSKSRTVTPKAGRMTTSSGVTAPTSKSPPSRRARNSTPIARSFELTWGLWMISPTRKMRLPGNLLRVSRQAHLPRSEEHTSELQSRLHLVCRLLLEKKKHDPPRTRSNTAQSHTHAS